MTFPVGSVWVNRHSGSEFTVSGTRSTRNGILIQGSDERGNPGEVDSIEFVRGWTQKKNVQP